MEPIGAIWGQNKLQCCSVGIVTIWHYRAEWKLKCESTAFADQLCSWHPFRVSHLHLLEKYERELREKYEPGLFEKYERGLRDSKVHFDCLLSGCHRTNPHQQAKRLFSIGIVNLYLSRWWHQIKQIIRLSDLSEFSTLSISKQLLTGSPWRTYDLILQKLRWKVEQIDG